MTREEIKDFLDMKAKLEPENEDICKEIVKMLEQEPRWIPVSERLPEDGTWNLFTDGKSVSVERYKSDAIDHFYPDGRWFEFEDAVAWMPKPKLYEPQESEG